MVPDRAPSLASQLPQCFRVLTDFAYTHLLCGSWLASDEASQNNRKLRSAPIPRRHTIQHPQLRPFNIGGARRDGGLGLRIVHRILQLHGREIQLIDVPGRGATFRFSLPIDEETASALAVRSMNLNTPRQA